jgi:hypothetical protein
MDANRDMYFGKGLCGFMSEKKQLLDIITQVIDESLANLHTATIARVTAVGQTTINCKPVLARVVDGQKVQLPEFKAVPPCFMQGGGSYTAHPIAVGDYALLIFTERCFDNWYGGVDNEIPLEYRMHDYSDGFAIVGINPLGQAIPIPSVIKQVGDTRQEGNYDHEGNRVQAGNHTITGNLTVNGNMTINGDGGGGTVNMNGIDFVLTGGDVTVDGVSVKSHTHNGVQTGSGNTGTTNT